MKLSCLFAVFITFHILTLPSFAQDVIRPNPDVEAKAAQALLDAEIKLQKSIPLNSQQKPEYEGYGNYFNEIAIAFARLGRTESALKATRFMSPNSASETQSEVLRLSVRRSTILGDVKRALSLIPQIKNNNAKADALLTVARAYLRQNDYDAAQKVLFQVTPLMPNNLSALTYTAYLFSQCGNIPVAKRLFDKAQKKVISLNNDYLTKRFEVVLLQSNFVDQWQSFHHRNSENILYDDVLEQLLKLGQVDAAINAIQQLTSIEEMLSLFDIAYYIAPKYPEKSTALLDKAAAKVTQMSIADRQNEETATQLAQSFDTYLAAGYARVNKKDEVQKWLEQLKKDTLAEDLPLAQLRYLTLPFFYSQRYHETSTFPPHQLLQINKEIQSHLPKLRADLFAVFILDQLIEAQIAAGQTSQARGNIEFLEKAARRKIDAGKENYGSIDAAAHVARLWKDVNDQQQCDALLQDIFDAPHEPLSKNEFLEIFIQNGLVDEAMRLFYTLPGNKQKLPQAIFRELPNAIAIAHPNQFPDELLRAKEPNTEARNISKFVHGLTNALFQTPSEQVLWLNPMAAPGINPAR